MSVTSRRRVNDVRCQLVAWAIWGNENDWYHELTGVSGQAMAATIDRAVRAVTSSRDVTYTIFALDYYSVKPMTIFYILFKTMVFVTTYKVNRTYTHSLSLLNGSTKHQLYKEDSSLLLEGILKLFSFQIWRTSFSVSLRAGEFNLSCTK